MWRGPMLFVFLILAQPAPALGCERAREVSLDRQAGDVAREAGEWWRRS